jgi:hypothetical protein
MGQLRARLEAAARSYQTPAGLDFPGVSLLAAGRRLGVSPAKDGGAGPVI